MPQNYKKSAKCTVISQTFCNSGFAELTLHSEKLKNIWFFSRFFVTLQDFSAFLCIKAVWEIEEKLGYELETVLNSTFCYEMHSMNTRC